MRQWLHVSVNTWKTTEVYVQTDELYSVGITPHKTRTDERIPMMRGDINKHTELNIFILHFKKCSSCVLESKRPV